MARAEAGAPGAWKPLKSARVKVSGGSRKSSNFFLPLSEPAVTAHNFIVKAARGSRFKYGAAAERWVASAGMPEFMLFVCSRITWKPFFAG